MGQSLAKMFINLMYENFSTTYSDCPKYYPNNSNEVGWFPLQKIHCDGKIQISAIWVLRRSKITALEHNNLYLNR